ncbi:MAG: SH3 domain-containing protein [Planctomycetota bacterium]
MSLAQPPISPRCRSGRSYWLIAICVCLCGAAALATELVVIEREAVIRRDKRTYSPKLATVKEGERVTLVTDDGAWLRVRYREIEGWISKTSVTKDAKVVLSGEAVASGVRATEQSAAGRGFSPEVERKYRTTRPALDAAFKVLDQVEAQEIDEAQIVAFIEAGLLVPADLQGGGK